MMTIKTDNLRLNKMLSAEQNSDMETIYSKKSSPFSTIIELLHISKERLSPRELSKIKQKLDDFYNLDCKRTTELRDDLNESLTIKSDKSIHELDDKKDKKDEENDCLNIEGLLLSQRRIYSQVCSFTNGSKIEPKNAFHHGSKKNTTTIKRVIENNFKPNYEKSNNIFEDKKETSKKFNNLIINGESRVTQKIEKNDPINKIAENINNKDYSNEVKMNNLKNKTLFKNEKDKLNTKNSVVIKNNEVSEKISYSDNKEKNKNIKDSMIVENNKVSENISYSDAKRIDKNTVLINVEGEKLNTENIYKEKTIEKNNDILSLYNVMPEYQKVSSEPVSDRKILDIPAFSILYKKVSTLSQPPSITYVFKKWGSENHQMKVNFGIYKKIQLIASTGRVYQSSLESFSQYQGRLPLSLESDNSHWHINAIDPSSENKEDEK